MRHQMSALVHWLYKSNKPQLQFPIQIHFGKSSSSTLLFFVNFYWIKAIKVHFFGGGHIFSSYCPSRPNQTHLPGIFKKKGGLNHPSYNFPVFQHTEPPGPKNLRLVALVIVSDEGEAIAMQGILSKSQMIRTIICISFEGCISSWKRWHSGSHHCHCCSLFVCFCVFNVGRRRQLEISWGGWFGEFPLWGKTAHGPGVSCSNVQQTPKQRNAWNVEHIWYFFKIGHVARTRH